MPTFKQLKCDNDLNEIIKSAFDSDLNLLGSWGYTQESATVLTKSDIPTIQLEHMFASMRAYTEMNMTLEEKERYGSINLNELYRDQIVIDNLIYDKVTYEITAMKEDVYALFIQAYKEGYGKVSFNMIEHFNQRKKATLTRTEVHWFEVQKTL